MSPKETYLPGLGYEVASSVLVLRVVDFSKKTVQGTIGMVLRRNEKKGADLMEEHYEDNKKMRFKLNCRNLKVSSVKIKGQDCDFRVLDSLKKLVDHKVRDLLSLSACLTGDLEAAGEGEMEIYLPFVPTEAILDVEIAYTFQEGLAVFCLKEDSDSDMEDHMYTRVGFSYADSLGGGCGARCLFPCVDTTRSRCPMKFLIETSKSHIAIAPGKLVNTLNATATTHIFEFDHPSPIAPYGVGIAVGPFVRIPHPNYSWISTYALATRASRFSTVPSRLAPCLKGMLEYLDQTKTPPSDYKQVFIAGERAADKVLPYSTMSILSDDLIHDRDVEFVSFADETESFLAQSVGIAAQWFGCGTEMGAGSPSDVWIPLGLSLFTAMQGLKSIRLQYFYEILTIWTKGIRATHSRGANVAKYHPRSGIVLGRPLTCPRPYSFPVDSALWAARGCSFDSPFASKAGLIMHMLEQRCSAMIFRDVLKRLATASHGPKPPIPSDHRPKYFTELAFLTLLKSRAGGQAHDVDANFVNQWLRHSYIPKFQGEVTYNIKQNRVEVVLRQQVPPQGGRIYMGAIKIRVVEGGGGGGTWDYEKQIDNIEHRWAFECRTVKRKGKGGRKKRTEETKKEDWRHPETLAATKLLSMAETKERYWESNSPVRYVLLDPDLAWIMDLTWKQPEEFWLEMLHDGSLAENTALQVFAVEQFGKYSTFNKETSGHLRASSAITAVLVDSSRQDSVRVEALSSLLDLHSKNAPMRLGTISGGGTWTGMNLLISAYKQLYCDRETQEPLPFSKKDGGYTVRSALIETLSLVSAKDGAVPDEIKELIFDAVRLADNSDNPLDDGPLISSLATAIGKLIGKVRRDTFEDDDNVIMMENDDQNDTGEAIRWVRSALDFDAVSPTPRNRKRATIGCLEALCEFELCGVFKSGTTDFASYLGSEGFPGRKGGEVKSNDLWRKDSDVRLKAFECILRIHIIERQSKGSRWMKVLRWLILKCTDDPSPSTRVKMMLCLLSAHADTVDRRWPEISGGETSPSGCFWPLLNTASDMSKDELEGAREVADALWSLINEKAAFDSSLRVLAHQLWRMIWKLEDVPCLEGLYPEVLDLGDLEKWAEKAEEEWTKDEKSIINSKELANMQAKQRQIVQEREEAKRLRREQRSKEAEEEEEQVVMGEEEVIMEDEEDDVGPREEGEVN